MPDQIVYNTLSRAKENFKPINGRKVNMFVCGQTVYDDAHLGHAKNYINFDVIARWLRFTGYEVKYIQNITDVDDKIIRRAAEEGTDPIGLARRFESRFMEDMEAIGVRKSVDMYPRSHDYIPEMVSQIQLLIDKGYAYVLDGDVYYDVSKFSSYTKLSGMKLEDLEKHRIEPKEAKRNSYDFALWKASKPAEPKWDITLSYGGKEHSLSGRPGWHIEDTAITHAIFGEQYDLHGGAIELIFPHHTNEIAQAEAAFGASPFVKYWLHSGIMLIKGEKMSKSLKNFVRIRDILNKFDAESVRLFVLSTHYRKDMAYSEELLREASSRLGYMYMSLGMFYNMNTVASPQKCAEVDAAMEGLGSGFSEAMLDDFNTPLAIAHLSSAIEALRKYAETYEQVSTASKESAIGVVTALGSVLGILQKDRYKETIPPEALALIKERESLRSEKKFAQADAKREEILKRFGIVIEDSIFGTLWRRAQ